jgi:hypothetical protein
MRTTARKAAKEATKKVAKEVAKKVAIGGARTVAFTVENANGSAAVERG